MRAIHLAVDSTFGLRTAALRQPRAAGKGGGKEIQAPIPIFSFPFV